MVFSILVTVTVIVCLAVVCYWLYTDGVKGIWVGLVVCIPVVLIGFTAAAAVVYTAHQAPSDRTETRVELSDDGKASVEVHEHCATTEWLYPAEVLTAIDYDFDTPEGTVPSDYEWTIEETE